MNVFQLLTVPLLTALLVRSALRFGRAKTNRRLPAAESMVWLLGLVAVLHPDLTMWAANSIGIGRGADLLLYVTAILVLLGAFYFYRRVQALESAVSQLVRELAIREALSQYPNRISKSDGLAADDDFSVETEVTTPARGVPDVTPPTPRRRRGLKVIVSSETREVR